MKPYLLPIALALVALSPTVGLSDVQYKTVVVAPPSPAPVSIDTCEVWGRDWAGKTIYGTHPLIGGAAERNIYIDIGVHFTNQSQKTVTAVRFAIASYDAFGAVLASANLDTNTNDSVRGQTFAPGQSVDLLGPRGWHGMNGHPERDHVSCAVAKVLFDDGTVWSAP